MRYRIRSITGMIVSPILSVTGYRFSKNYRHGATLWHRVVYSWVDTVGANIRAGIES